MSDLLIVAIAVLGAGFVLCWTGVIAALCSPRFRTYLRDEWGF